jgi:hypothetical protein
LSGKSAEIWGLRLPNNQSTRLFPTYHLSLNSAGNLSFGYRVGGGNYSIASSTPVELNRWFHFAAVRNKGHAGEADVGSRLYQDGQEVKRGGEINDYPFTWTLNRPLSIGADHIYSGSGGVGHFHGLIDEVIFYSGGMDAMQICNQYLAFCRGNLVGVDCDTSCLGD